MNKPLDLDALQALHNSGETLSYDEISALIAELREARAKLPHHCGGEDCAQPLELGSCMCSCYCDDCMEAEDKGIYADEGETMSAVIWWTTGPDCAIVAEALHNQPSLLPPHIVDAFDSRRGRAGRGRLWPVDGLDPVEVTCDAEHWDSPLGKVLTEYYGGIVIDAADLGAVWDLPGIVTDLRIARVSKT